MVLTAVLVRSLTITKEINSPTNNNHLSFPAYTSGPNPSSVGVFPQTSSASSSDSHVFGVFHLTTVGMSDATIRTLVSVPISASPYRNSLITKLFFRQILGYVNSPSIFISNFVSTVASYFDMRTAVAEQEVEVAVISIRDTILCIYITCLVFAFSLQS